VPVRIFHLAASRELATHLNYFRMKMQGVRRIPDVAYNMYKSRFEAPALSEGAALPPSPWQRTVVPRHVGAEARGGGARGRGDRGQDDQLGARFCYGRVAPRVSQVYVRRQGLAEHWHVCATLRGGALSVCNARV
jgi:hypothetical protein